MTRQERAGVLGTGKPLYQAFAQVAQGGYRAEDETEQQALPDGKVQRAETAVDIRKKTPVQRADKCASSKALP